MASGPVFLPLVESSSSGSSSEEEDGEEMLEDEEVQPASGGDGLAISQELARSNYSEAGSTVEEQGEPIKLQDYARMLDTTVLGQLEELLSTLGLPALLARRLPAHSCGDAWHGPECGAGRPHRLITACSSSP